MSGIVSYGAYVPYFRLQRAAIGAAMESRSGKGERSVASYDEDSVTMAVEAGATALTRVDSDSVTSVYFASTSAPYQEKLNAATVHAALNLKSTARALDFAGSVRVGLGSLIMANESASVSGNALVTQADVRMGAPEGAAEANGGDGAVAFVMGTENVIAEVVATYSETLEHLALWRLPGQDYPKTWEDRFGLTQVYTPLLLSGAQKILEESGVAAGDLSRVIIDVPNARAAAALIKALGIDPGVVEDTQAGDVGHTGVAHAGLMLAAALDKAKEGQKILVVSVSDGVDAVIFETTSEIKNYSPVTAVAKLIASKRNDLAYNRYLKWRGILNSEPPRRPDPSRPAGPPSFRSRDWKFRFIGSECTECGTRHLPPQKVCVKCGAVGQMKDAPYAKERGTVATYTLDHLAFHLAPPMVMAMVDFAVGGRAELEITDCDPEKVEIGNELVMTFRRLFTADGVHNYFWKARPDR
jgi:3-hydroxy-3-methylglutaryl CoA synthase